MRTGVWKLPITHWLPVVGLLAAIVLVSLLTAYLGYTVSVRDMGKRLHDSLGLVQRSLQADIAYYRALPAVLVNDQRVVNLIDRPDGHAVAGANAYLQTIRDRTGAAEMFVMDAQGLTLASSNWDSELSFVGHNYSFRPYFQDALSTGAGHFYAVGVTSGVPGYFLSSLVETAQGKRGVVVVKLDLSTLENSWRDADAFIALADSYGVVFLSGRAEWKYRFLWPVSAAAEEELRVQRKYNGLELSDTDTLLDVSDGQEVIGVPIEVDGLLFELVALEEEGWFLVTAGPLDLPRRFALMIGVVTWLSGLLVSGLYFYMRQRRQFVQFQFDQNAVLEERVAVRTQELAHEVAERRRAETHLRETQNELVQAAKLAVLGQMSAAIVHEVSQPLAAISAMLGAARQQAEQGDTEAAVDKIARSGEIARDMQGTIRHLRSFARKERGRLEAVDPVAVVRSAIELSEPRARELGVALNCTAPQGVWLVMANPVRFEQVILNLLLNALDAVEPVADRRIEIAVTEAPEGIVVSIGDTGVGIPAEIGRRIAEPFFTTKPEGRGLGLGLTISQTIIKAFGGQIRFRARPGGGTICEVVLPVRSAKGGGTAAG